MLKTGVWGRAPHQPGWLGLILSSTNIEVKAEARNFIGGASETLKNAFFTATATVMGNIICYSVHVSTSKNFYIGHEVSQYTYK